MTDLLSLFAPFFALVLLGWAAARARILPLDGIGALNAFVLYFSLPALLFRLGVSGAFRQPGMPGLLVAYGVAGTLIVVLALLWTRRAGLRRRDGGLVALVTAFPNTGFLGLPLLTGLLGPLAAGPLAATLLVDVLWLSSLCLAWAHSAAVPGARAHGEEGRAVRQSLKGALRNPLLWAIAAGAAVGWAEWSLPGPVDATVKMLGLSATPVALFTLGAMLARAQMRAAAPSRSDTATTRTAGAAVRGVWVLAVLKLVLHAALIWGLGQGLRHLGMAISPLGLLTMTLAGALPSASNVSMLAEREGADVALVARVILWTTAASLLTLTAWAYLLGLPELPVSSAP